MSQNDGIDTEEKGWNLTTHSLPMICTHDTHQERSKNKKLCLEVNYWPRRTLIRAPGNNQLGVGNSFVWDGTTKNYVPRAI